PDGYVHRAFQRHVDRAVGDLVGCPSQIDGDLVPRDCHGHLDGQIPPPWVWIIEKPIDVGGSTIRAIRYLRNGLAHQAFGIVHHGSAGSLKRVKAVLAHQRLYTLRPDTRRSDLRLHIANDQVRDANVVAQELPHRLDLVASLIDLDSLELQP